MIAETSGWRRKSTRQVMIQPAVTPLVDGVDKDTPAEKAGVKTGDIITAVNGVRFLTRSVSSTKSTNIPPTS